MTSRSPHLRLPTATTLLLAGSVTLAAGSPATEAERRPPSRSVPPA